MQHYQGASCTRKIKEWFWKWDRTIAATTTLVLFFIVLAIVIIKKIDHLNEDKSDEKKSSKFYLVPKFFFNSDSPERCSFSPAEKILTCSNIKVKELVEAINQAADYHEIDTDIQLVLNEISFENGKIEKGFLDGININFNKLTISGWSVRDIGEAAFSEGPFQTPLDPLRLTNTMIEVVRKDMFLGAKINHFTMDFNDFHYLRLEDNSFEAISKYLTQLDLIQCIQDSKDIVNVTGPNTNMTSLSTLILQYNKLTTLNSLSFDGAPNLSYLYLSHSGIENIPQKIFHKQRLTLLDLSYNQLTTLPEGIFDTVQQGIFIKENSWNCTCDLVWLRDLYDSRGKSLFSDDFYCTLSPTKKVIYTKVNFCNSSTTDIPPPVSSTTPLPSTTTPSSAPEPTTTLPPDSVEIPCYPAQSSTENQIQEKSNIQLAIIRKQTIKVFFVQVAESPLIYHLNFEGADISKEVLIRINSENREDISCLAHLNSVNNKTHIVQENLRHASTYTFCLMDSESSTVSPYDCTAFSVPPEWKDRAWIPNRLKIASICLFVGSLLMALLISAAIAFFWIRAHPNLIKGNKRVIVVGRKTAETKYVVMPKNYDASNYRPPSFNSGYLTPVNEGCRIEGPLIREGGGRRTSNTIYRTMRRVRLQHVAETVDDHLYEPPPLPPNHPSEWIYSSSVNSYSHI